MFLSVNLEYTPNFAKLQSKNIEKYSPIEISFSVLWLKKELLLQEWALFLV